MNPNLDKIMKLEDSIEQAEKFIEKAGMAIKKLKDINHGYFVHSSKEMATAKRASMDLTNSLVLVRNNSTQQH